MDALTLIIPKEDSLTDDELFRICSANKELRIERDELGQLIIMSPAGSFSSNKNFILNSIFGAWVEAHSNLGVGFDSSGGFILPDRSMRSPDAAWIKKDRWEALTLESQEKFAPICPDFIIELRSKSDKLSQLKDKMEKWISNGCSLAWLIDPIEQKSYIYKPNEPVTEIIGFHNTLYGDRVLPGFELPLTRLI
jgi:Uma2 family endonuclease